LSHQDLNQDLAEFPAYDESDPLGLGVSNSIQLLPEGNLLEVQEEQMVKKLHQQSKLRLQIQKEK